MRDVVVVGAGISGLAAAHALRDLDVLVIDGAAQVGGKLRTSPVAGIDVDEGAEAFLARRPEAVDLARDAGLADALRHPTATTAQLWARGGLRPIPPRTVVGVPSSLRSLRGVLSPAEIARAALDRALPAAARDGDVSVGALVGGRMGRAVVDRLVDPLLGGVYAGRADELSARVTVPALAAARGSLLRAAAATLPPTTPQRPVFATVHGGLGRLATAVAEWSGAAFVLGRLVRRLERTPEGFRVVHGPTTDEQAVTAKAVVLAVPPPAAARLLADLAPVAAGELAGIEVASLAIVTTAWRRADLPPGASSGYLVPAVTGRPVKAVTFTSAKWADAATGDVVVARCSLGRHGDTAVLQRDDADLVSLAVEELRRHGGALGEPLETRLTRWGGALPQPAVGHLERVARIRAAVAAVPGLAVCGAAYDGVGIPACIATGRQAAAQVRPAASQPSPARS